MPSVDEINTRFDARAGFWQARAWHGDTRLRSFRIAVFSVVMREWGKALIGATRVP